MARARVASFNQTTAESNAQLILDEPGSALKAAAKLITQTRTLNEPGSPTETTIESVAWYLMAINPFFDYTFVLPTGHQVLMLDWAKDEDVLFPIVFQGKEWPYMLWQLETASAPGPKAKSCLTSLQKRLVSRVLEAPGRAKLIGIHSPPIGPYPDWLESDMLAGRKQYTDPKNARGRTDYGTKRPDGSEQPWHGHPIFAIRPRSGEAGMDTDYGSMTQDREWLIKELANPKNGVRAVFSGHIHRNGLYTVHTESSARGPLLAGEMLVRQVVEQAVRGAKPPSVVQTPDAFPGPLYVNTTSGGPRGNNMSRPPTQDEVRTGGLSTDPGYSRLEISADGTIYIVEFRSSLATAAQKPAARERTMENMLQELGWRTAGNATNRLAEIAGLDAGTIDDYAASRSTSATATASEWTTQLDPARRHADNMESHELPMNLMSLNHRYEDARSESDNAWLHPREMEQWSGEGLEWPDAESAKSTSTVELEPEVADLAEQVMARGASISQETSAWTPCFTRAEIDNVVSAYSENAVVAASDKGARCSCIVMLNVALGKLLPLPTKLSRARGTSDRWIQTAALTTESIEQAMDQLRDQGFASAPTVLDFLDRRGQTAGTLKPERLKDSVQEMVAKRSDTNGCWYAYGVSIMDGYHSVLLLVERQSASFRIYWLDQFSAGLDTNVTDALDQRLTDKTQAWWLSVMDTKKKGYSTMIRIWQLRKPLSS